jgi:hypothetical protein
LAEDVTQKTRDRLFWVISVVGFRPMAGPCPRGQHTESGKGMLSRRQSNAAAKFSTFTVTPSFVLSHCQNKVDLVTYSTVCVKSAQLEEFMVSRCCDIVRLIKCQVEKKITLVVLLQLCVRG